MKKLTVFITICIFSISIACKKQENTLGTGKIIFTANGEDFIRNGFVSKDGWRIDFKNLFVNISEPTAYSPDNNKIILKGNYWVDLAIGSKDEPPVVLKEMNNVNSGNYQSLKFNIRKTELGKYKGYSIVMIGTAIKNGQNKNFTIKLDEEIDYNGKEGFVGDEIKGLITPNGETKVEMTFHFDHIFGDINSKAAGHINTNSNGFEFFNKYAKGNIIDVSQAEMKSSAGYKTLVKAIWTLGHLGEGHCESSNQSSANIFN